MSKTNPGNHFEDFRIGQVIRHATPRTITDGDRALYAALYGLRFAVQSPPDTFAQAIGYRAAPFDDLLVFHIVFGKTVPDISLNAVANLGYAGAPSAARSSPATHCRDFRDRRTEGKFQRQDRHGLCAHGWRQPAWHHFLPYVRWVMVQKRDEASTAPAVKSAATCAIRPGILVAPVPRPIGALTLRLPRQHAALCGRLRDR